MDFRRQPDPAVAWLAILQLLHVILFECEAIEIGKLRRITELSNRKKAGKFTQCIDIRCKPEVALRSGFDVHGAEDKNLVGGSCVYNLCDGRATADRRNLVIVQSNVLPKEFATVRPLADCR